MIVEALRHGETECSVEEYRQVVVRHGAQSGTAYGYKQLTSGQLKQRRPAAGQNGFEGLQREQRNSI